MRELNSSKAIDEMAIVDVFTKLIFNADVQLDRLESLLLELLQQQVGALSGASRRDISEYLRSMAVDEMIDLVGELKQQFDRRNLLIAQSHNSVDTLRH